jgi:uncharacterized delta-60 repeat protein
MNPISIHRQIKGALLLIAAWLLTGTQVLALPGDIDTQFGKDGIVTTGFGSGSDWGQAVAAQSDGKVVVAGFSITRSGTTPIAVSRYNADGSLDKTFGKKGRVITALHPVANAIQGVALQADGKIVLAGAIWNLGFFDFALMRLNADGSPDSTFGTNGGVVTSIDARDDMGNCVAIQPDGKILVSGYSFNGVVSNNEPARYNVALARYNPNGMPDAGFGTGGVAITPMNASVDDWQGLALQSDGKILIATNQWNGADYDCALLRYYPNGSPDTAFGTGGKVLTSVGDHDDFATGVGVQGDGKIVVGGYSDQGSAALGSDWDFAVMRYNADGTSDTEFGAGGRRLTDFRTFNDIAMALLIQGDGKIVLAGLAGSYPDSTFALSRYTTDGKADTSFGSGGRVRTVIGKRGGLGVAVARQGASRILMAGMSVTGIKGGTPKFDFALARYRSRSDADALISSSQLGMLTGDGIFNKSGTRQNLKIGIDRGQTHKFLVTIQNEATQPQSFRVTGAPKSDSFTVKYLDEALKDITRRVVSGSYLLENIPIGASRTITMEITVKPKAKPRSSRAFKVQVFSEDGEVIQDTVKAVATSR